MMLLSLLEPWKETHPLPFIYKFSDYHNANLKRPPEFLWTKDTVECISCVSVQTAYCQVS